MPTRNTRGREHFEREEWMKFLEVFSKIFLLFIRAPKIKFIVREKAANHRERRESLTFEPFILHASSRGANFSNWHFISCDRFAQSKKCGVKPKRKRRHGPKFRRWLTKEALSRTPYFTTSILRYVTAEVREKKPILREKTTVKSLRPRWSCLNKHANPNYRRIYDFVMLFSEQKCLPFE